MAINIPPSRWADRNTALITAEAVIDAVETLGEDPDMTIASVVLTLRELIGQAEEGDPDAITLLGGQV